jgi:hypothetical protein
MSLKQEHMSTEIFAGSLGSLTEEAFDGIALIAGHSQFLAAL